MKPSVLLLDDEPALGTAFATALAPETSRLATFSHVAEAMSALLEGTWDVVLADLYLEGETALDLMAQMRSEQVDAAVVLITGRPKLEDLAAAMRMGAHDFLVKPASVHTLRQAIARAAATVRIRRAMRAHMASLQATLDAKSERCGYLEASLETMERAVVESLMAALAARESNSMLHSLRVREYALHLAECADYPVALRKHLANAALLHDIGKLGLSDALLFRPGPFTATDLDRMKPHASMGEQILGRMDFLRPAARIVRHHHERYDGSGYPDGLASENIPLGARIFTIADALDALTNDQVYRAAQSFDDAQQEIIRWSGRQFDPKLMDFFRRITPTTWRQLRARAEEEFEKSAPMHLLPTEELAAV